MIKYTLQCDVGHEFESWFSSGSSFDSQADSGLVSCPLCSSTKVEKALMAPNISTGVAKDGASRAKRDDGGSKGAVLAHASEVVEKIKKSVDFVGDEFAREARKIHYEGAPSRPIWGNATRRETSDLIDEGIGVIALPRPAKDHN